MNMILKRPLISEKTMKQAKEGLYTFLVDKKARKQEIAREIERRFSVSVIAIKTSNYKDITRMQRGVRRYYTVTGFKKAAVQLKEGQRLTVFETEAHQEEAVPTESGSEVKEKKSLLKGTKVKIEKVSKEKKEKE